MPDEERVFVVRLSDELARVLSSRVRQVRDRLGDLSDDPLASLFGGPVERPDDVALLRLLPDAVGTPGSDDPLDRMASDARRSSTDHDLRARKAADAELVLHQLDADGPPELTERDMETWIRALNDVRLLMGADLGLPDPPDEDTPAVRRVLAEYDTLMDLQQTLLDRLDPGLTEQVYKLARKRPWER